MRISLTSKWAKKPYESNASQSDASFHVLLLIASVFFKVELKLALETNIVINLDNDSEIRMVDDLLNGELKAKVDSGEVVPRVGLRVNPVVGGGAIAIIATATKYSKFGIPIMDETRQMVIDLYKTNEWLTGIHIHVGSQGVPLEKFVSGAKVCSSEKNGRRSLSRFRNFPFTFLFEKVCYDFVKELEAATGRALKTIDIGGGLSTDYKNEAEPEGFTFALYRKRLDETVPELFSGKYRIITEFGRSLFLKVRQFIFQRIFSRRFHFSLSSSGRAYDYEGRLHQTVRPGREANHLDTCGNEPVCA